MWTTETNWHIACVPSGGREVNIWKISRFITSAATDNHFWGSKETLARIVFTHLLSIWYSGTSSRSWWNSGDAARLVRMQPGLLVHAAYRLNRQEKRERERKGGRKLLKNSCLCQLCLFAAQQGPAFDTSHLRKKKCKWFFRCITQRECIPSKL